MAPIEGLSGSVLAGAGPMMGMAAPAGPPGGTISMSTLMDYIIQRTYHELTVMSDLLPRKTDMERKIEIVQFASRTRQLFVRLLALVKWANSASKVDKCASISNFLDQQSMRFIETADVLSKLSRDTLSQARLPSFSLPCAIDVLTTGSFPRLPACIKDRIVPQDPITPLEKRDTLARLNQIIEYRLVTSTLPKHMRRLKIDNGRVRFYVEHEFGVTLTLMGDGSDVPWRLLDIEILVEDPETGDGKSLVHPLQVNYIHQLAQSRLIDCENPLEDLYGMMHSFCQSLQLEVLHVQAVRLINERLGDHVRIEDYSPGKSLLMSYWRDTSRSRDSHPHRGCFPAQNYKLHIHIDSCNASRPLQITHAPQIQGSESIKVSMAIRSDHLSIEKLLIHTIQVRSTAKLKDLERKLRCIIPGPSCIRELPPVLYVPILHPCMEAEKLAVSVDIQTGQLLLSLGEHSSERTDDIEACLNGEHRDNDLKKRLIRLRLDLGLQRCRMSIQHISASCSDSLPLIKSTEHPLEQLGPHRLYLRIPKYPTYYLVIGAYERDKAVTYKYYILQVSPVDQGLAELDDSPLAYLQPGHMIQLDAFLCTHGPTAKLYTGQATIQEHTIRKRKLVLGETEDEPPAKKGPGVQPSATPSSTPSTTDRSSDQKSSYLIPQLTHILAVCEDRIPFLQLSEELQKRRIPHTGVQIDGDGNGLCLKLLGAPVVSGKVRGNDEGSPDENTGGELLAECLLSCTFRIQRKGSPTWVVECVFTNSPLRSTNIKEQAGLTRVYYLYEMLGGESMAKVASSLQDDWIAAARLYAMVTDFAECYNENVSFRETLEVKSFTYKKLTLGYGSHKGFTVGITYRVAEQKFHLSFGSALPSPVSNCHVLMQLQLQRLLNQTTSISRLAQVLVDTWSPLAAIGKLNTSPMMGVTTRPNQPLQTFTLLPQSPTHIRIVYRSVYCIDVHCRGGQLVAVRDGAYSLFDTTKAIDGLTPVPMLRAFLNQFVDEGAAARRRQSTTEDDNPPSPVTMDTVDFLSGSTGSPATGVTRGVQKDLAARFGNVNPMTPPSNPHTPASPAGRLNHVTPGPSPMMGTPSPGMLGQGSPGTLHVPSPGSFQPAPSPHSLGIHMPSPASGAHLLTHPGQSLLSPPSRLLPQRSWAASSPTLLSHEGLHKLFSPHPATPSSSAPSPLEQFLGSSSLSRHVRRVVTSEESLLVQPCQEPGVILFKVDSLQFRVSMSPNLQSLHLKVTPTQEHHSAWEAGELEVLEKFFELKVACLPYRANSMTAFSKLLGAPLAILKDCVHIMKLELMPEPNMKWSVQWCLTIPHGDPPIAPVGTPAVVIKDKVLFMLQLTRIGVAPGVPPGMDSQSVIVPVLHNIAQNMTQIPERPVQQSQAQIAIKNQLKHFMEYNTDRNRCSVYPAVRELVMNLNIPM